MHSTPPPPHSRSLPEPGLYEIRRARAVMRYWNLHPFEGRFKTLQTERAEELLRRAGLDPSRVGLPARPVRTGETVRQPLCRPMPPLEVPFLQPSAA